MQHRYCGTNRNTDKLFLVGQLKASFTVEEIFYLVFYGFVLVFEDSFHFEASSCFQAKVFGKCCRNSSLETEPILLLLTRLKSGVCQYFVGCGFAQTIIRIMHNLKSYTNRLEEFFGRIRDYKYLTQFKCYLYV